MVLEGEGFIELDGERVPAKPMTAVFIKPGCRHRAVGQMKIINIPIPAFDLKTNVSIKYTNTNTLAPCLLANSAIYDINFETIDGQKKSLSDFAGKPILIVNVASQCGYTPQYAGLQLLHEKYNKKGSVLLAFRVTILRAGAGTTKKLRSSVRLNIT